jgi:hypothetical protein
MKAKHFRINVGRAYMLFQKSPEFMLYENDLHISFGRVSITILWKPIKANVPENGIEAGCYMRILRWNKRRNGFNFNHCITFNPYKYRTL